MADKIRLFQKIILDGVTLSLLVIMILILELNARHMKNLLLAGLSLFLVISAFLIQDMFSSLWKIPVAFILLISANAIFQKVTADNKNL